MAIAEASRVRVHVRLGSEVRARVKLRVQVKLGGRAKIKLSVRVVIVAGQMP